MFDATVALDSERHRWLGEVIALFLGGRTDHGAQSLRGWTRLHPPTSRPPSPRSAMAEIARQQALAGEMEPALLTWILF